MAEIREFRALEFNKDLIKDLSDVICPPYDIISNNSRSKFIDISPYNAIRLELPSRSDESAFKEWRQRNVLIRDKEEGMYIYEEKFNIDGVEKSVRGIICLVKLEDFPNKVILPHEYTLTKAKQGRLELLKNTFCNFSPIYCVYEDKTKQVENIISDVSNKTEDMLAKSTDEIIHKVWKITNKEKIKLLKALLKSCRLYIADGHHRYETALNFRNWCRDNNIKNSSDYVMMWLVDKTSDGIEILPTHRVVKNIEGFDYKNLLRSCEKYFDIGWVGSLDEANEFLVDMDGSDNISFVLYTKEGGFYTIKLKGSSGEKIGVEVLHELILKGALGISTEKLLLQKNLEYTRNKKEAIRLVSTGDANCAFLLNPTKISQICNIADAGKRMPQKSTYFYPKPITGMIMNLID